MMPLTSAGSSHRYDTIARVATGFTNDERAEIRDALRIPRGRYSVERAAQLSGVPQRTLYDWARSTSSWTGALQVVVSSARQRG